MKDVEVVREDVPVYITNYYTNESEQIFAFVKKEMFVSKILIKNKRVVLDPYHTITYFDVITNFDLLFRRCNVSTYIRIFVIENLCKDRNHNKLLERLFDFSNSKKYKPAYNLNTIPLIIIK